MNFIDFNGLEPISAEKGQKIADEARKWGEANAPYVMGGKTKSGADCSGSTWTIYKDSRMEFPYSPTATFERNPKFKPVQGDPQVGDIGLFPGHMVIFDPKAATGIDAWTARHTGGKPYGAGSSSWFGTPK